MISATNPPTKSSESHQTSFLSNPWVKYTCAALATIGTTVLVYSLFQRFKIDQLDSQCWEFEKSRSFPKALNCYQKAAAEGSSTAQNRLGEAYAFGELGVQRDHTKAAEYFRQAFNQGDYEKVFTYAALQVALQDDSAKGTELIKQAADNGHPESQYAMGNDHFLRQDFCEQSNEKAFTLWSTAAQNGHEKAKAMMNMALVYGKGCEKDVQKGMNGLHLLAYGPYGYGPKDAEAPCFLREIYQYHPEERNPLLVNHWAHKCQEILRRGCTSQICITEEPRITRLINAFRS